MDSGYQSTRSTEVEPPSQRTSQGLPHNQASQILWLSFPYRGFLHAAGNKTTFRSAAPAPSLTPEKASNPFLSQFCFFWST